MRYEIVLDLEMMYVNVNENGPVRSMLLRVFRIDLLLL